MWGSARSVIVSGGFVRVKDWNYRILIVFRQRYPGKDRLAMLPVVAGHFTLIII